jgi:uncharacterized protein (DUF4415 family)
MAPKKMSDYPNNTDFPELTDEQLDRMRPAREVHPPAFFEAVKRRQGQRGPGKKPAKIAVSIRIDPDTLAALKKTGAGWQGRVNEALRKLAAPRTRPNPVRERLRKRITSKKQKASR